MSLLVFLLTALTDLGDSAVLTALVLSMATCLLAQGNRREAVIVVGAFLMTSITISLAKVLLMGCGSALRHYGLQSPSGHSGLSFVTYGMLAILLRSRVSEKRRNYPLPLLIGLALSIAASRVLLGFHTREEVYIGLFIGSVVLIITAKVLTTRPLHSLNHYIVAYVAVTTVFLMHGVRLPAESLIQLIASYFRHVARCA